MELFLRELSQKIFGEDSESYAQAGKLIDLWLKMHFSRKTLLKNISEILFPDKIVSNNKEQLWSSQKISKFYKW